MLAGTAPWNKWIRSFARPRMDVAGQDVAKNLPKGHNDDILTKLMFDSSPFSKSRDQ
jgi:hypothetical protein